MKPAYLWFDTETTGLDVAHAALLEVGAAVVTTDFDIISTFERVLYFNRADHNAHIAPIDPVVQDMHHVNGLWDACEKSKLLPVEVDQQLTIWTRAFFKPGEAVLAGRSIWFDRDVAKLHLPKFHGLLHHRQLETYSIERVCNRLNAPDFDAPNHPHRAMGDVMGDLEVARDRVNWLRGVGKPDLADSWWTL